VSAPGAASQWAGTPPAVTSLTTTSSGSGCRRPAGANAARRCSKLREGWLAAAFCWPLRVSITSCMAWLGISASPDKSWRACGRGASASIPGLQAGRELGHDLRRRL
jgi:hypothetical protein